MNYLRSLALLVLIPSLCFSGWHDSKYEGWAWYEDPTKPEKKESIEKKVAAPSEQMALIRKELENKLSLAVQNPTEENVFDYMKAQQYWLNQSVLFSQVWGKALLNHPELDATIAHPVSQYGIAVAHEIENERRTSFIRSLAKDYGLFFLFEGQKKTSQALAKVVKMFSDKHRWSLLTISVDGTVLDLFPDSKVDNGASKRLGIETYPALVLVNPKTQEVIPIAFGLVSLDQIESNIVLQFQEDLDG